MLDGDLLIPENATGVVLFAHGSGSSRFSSRNRFVAEALRECGLGTLLIDLLMPEEQEELRFDIPLLARRLSEKVEWLRAQNFKVGLFGASTGGGAALVAAAQKPDAVRAVVSRGGRPDLAGDALPHVQAPTLLIVGGDDIPVIGMNRAAFEKLSCEKRMEIVPGASHLFEEPGTLEQVARLAREWFARFL